MDRLHDDELRTQSRARRPAGGVSAVSQDLILRSRAFARRLEGWTRALMVRDGASAPPHHEAYLSYCFTAPSRAFRTSVASHTMRLPRSRPNSSIGSRLSMCPNCPL